MQRKIRLLSWLFGTLAARGAMAASVVLAALFCLQVEGQKMADVKVPAPPFAVTTTRAWRPTPHGDSPGNVVYFSPRNSLKGNGDHTPSFKAVDFRPVTMTTSIDWIKDFPFPMDLNDQLGDCYYAAGCHFDNLLTANVGKESFFSLAAIRSRYLTLSGGDNGLNDGDMQKEMTRRYLADIPDAKIIDYAYIDSNDVNSMQAAISRYGASFFTFAVAPAWIRNSETGATWDASGYTQNDNGHAVTFGGVSSLGNYKLLTWGTWVWITPAAVKVCQPSSWVAFSVRWFGPLGYAPNGQHITALAKQWQLDTGRAIPPDVIAQFPPAGGPPPPPPPPSPTTHNVVTWTVNGVTSSWELVPVGTIETLRKFASGLDNVP